MVAVFAGLKWHLLLGRLRAVQKSRRPWLLLGFLVALALVGFVAFGIITSRGYPETARAVAILLMTLQLISWVIAPLVAFGVDETVDPHRFSLLPLSRGTLIRGLTVTSLIGWLPLINLLWLLAIAVALSTSWSMLPLAVVVVLVQLLLCIVLSRAAATAMSALMNSRRGRDLGMLVGFGLFALYMLATSLLGNSNGEGFNAALLSVTGALAWLPPGALARIPGLVHDGDWGQAGVAVLIAAAGLGLALYWWMKALARTLESGSSMTESSAPSSSDEFGALGRRATGVTGIVAARDVVLIWRDPMRRISWLISIVMAFGWPLLVIQSGHGALFAVAFGSLLMGLQAANQLALDGSGLWLHLVMSGERSKYRDEIRGHVAVALVPGLVVVVLATVLFAILRSDLDLLPGALGINIAAMLGSAAFSCWLSAALPYGVPQSRSSMFASAAPGQKGRSGGASLAVMGGGLAVAIPSAVLTWIGADRDVAAWGWAALVVGIVLGTVMLLRLIEIAATKYFESGPEILHLVSAGDRV